MNVFKSMRKLLNSLQLSDSLSYQTNLSRRLSPCQRVDDAITMCHPWTCKSATFHSTALLSLNKHKSTGVTFKMERIRTNQMRTTPSSPHPSFTGYSSYQQCIASHPHHPRHVIVITRKRDDVTLRHLPETENVTSQATLNDVTQFQRMNVSFC